MGTGFNSQYQQYPQYAQYSAQAMQPGYYYQPQMPVMPQQSYTPQNQSPTASAVNIQIFNPTANAGPQYPAMQPAVPNVSKYKPIRTKPGCNIPYEL